MKHKGIGREKDLSVASRVLKIGLTGLRDLAAGAVKTLAQFTS